jgi:hypothetical protein
MTERKTPQEIAAQVLKRWDEHTAAVWATGRAVASDTLVRWIAEAIQAERERAIDLLATIFDGTLNFELWIKANNDDPCTQLLSSEGEIVASCPGEYYSLNEFAQALLARWSISPSPA